MAAAAASASNLENKNIAFRKRDIGEYQTLLFNEYQFGKYFFDIITSVNSNLEIVLINI